jgi:HPt (histidine-containing phosphotransfer) domain-containing protein
MELSGNNNDTVNDIMDIFIKQNPKRLEELQEYFVKNDWASLKSLCHKMRSSYSIIGSFEVKNMLEMIEVECSKKNVDIEKFSGQIERIIMLNEKILKEIKLISVK